MLHACMQGGQRAPPGEACTRLLQLREARALEQQLMNDELVLGHSVEWAGPLGRRLAGAAPWRSHRRRRPSAPHWRACGCRRRPAALALGGGRAQRRRLLQAGGACSVGAGDRRATGGGAQPEGTRGERAGGLTCGRLARLLLLCSSRYSTAAVAPPAITCSRLLHFCSIGQEPAAWSRADQTLWSTAASRFQADYHGNARPLMSAHCAS